MQALVSRLVKLFRSLRNLSVVFPNGPLDFPSRAKLAKSSENAPKVARRCEKLGEVGRSCEKLRDVARSCGKSREAFETFGKLRKLAEICVSYGGYNSDDLR